MISLALKMSDLKNLAHMFLNMDSKLAGEYLSWSQSGHRNPNHLGNHSSIRRSFGQVLLVQPTIWTSISMPAHCLKITQAFSTNFLFYQN